MVLKPRFDLTEDAPYLANFASARRAGVYFFSSSQRKEKRKIPLRPLRLCGDNIFLHAAFITNQLS
jgi:hypothetical protein